MITMGKQKWTAVCEHVIKIEDEYLQKEILIEEVEDRFVIILGEDEDVYKRQE